MSPLARVVLFAGLAAVVVYAAVKGNLTGTNLTGTDKATAKRTAAPGWEQLDACSPMQSLDDTRELTFLEDHTVNLLERETKTKRELGPSKVAGTWAFDESAKRYFVSLAQQQKSYVLIQPDNSELCILLSGEPTAANISESWFGRTLEDMNDDREPPDRY
jgi:hypothetical protein